MSWRVNFIDLKTQYAQHKDDIQRQLNEVLDNTQFIMGPKVTELEAQLADYVGVSHSIACSSGTDALLLALLAKGVKPGDEVITTPFTFIATVEVISLLGARPVFADINEQTYNSEPAAIETAITERTRGIIPVSLYGQAADMDEINAIAASHGLWVLEDGAQSLGATYKGRHSCGLSEIGATSFFPSKPLGCYGDGGAVFTDDDSLAEALRALRVHGQKQRYRHHLVGVDARMDAMQAAVLLAKLPHFQSEVELRREKGAYYSERLAGHVITPVILPHNTSVFAQYTIRVPERDSFCASLKDDGIPTAVHYPVPVHMQEAYSDLGYGAGSFPVAERMAHEVVSLPMFPHITKAQQDLVIEAVVKATSRTTQHADALAAP
ncbi:MAG: DegT/DnrJ/EryC1/StrS family aminotransferase [Pseudomonadota bacterium]|nr:MAG: DegT/DnrJ/EryC1/StrS family aminotransferase [Pseudomonadota bacterium]